MGTATATLNADVQSIQAPSGAVGEDPSHLAFWDTLTGTTPSNWLFNLALTNDPDAITLGRRLIFDVSADANSLVFTYTDSGMSNRACEKALRGVLANGIYATVHDEDPTDDGDTGRITSITPMTFPFASFTFAHTA